MGRKIGKTLFWVLILILLVLPLGLIWRISSAEMEEYAVSESPVIRQSAVGTPVQAVRQDLQLYVTVSGSFTSTEVAFMELEQEEPWDIRWVVSYGDEIQVGQLLGYYHGEEIRSTVEGILSGINTSGDAYIMVDCLEPLVLECQVDDATLASLRQFSDSLTLDDGTAVKAEYIAKMKNFDGTTTVRLSLNREGDAYGAAEELTVYLGTGYPQVLVLPLNCVYQKDVGDEEPWYVRQVTEDGLFIGEVQVTLAYANSSVAVVNGIEEGQWFDSGYKAVANG